MDSTNPFDRNAPLPDTPWPVAPKSLLSKREQALYAVIQNLYPGHRIFIQVALSQLIDVARDHPKRKLIRSRFKQLVADFVVCKPDLSILAVIELDDRSHRRPDRQAADARKTKALTDAGLRLIRIPEGPLPSAEALRQIIDSGPSMESSRVSTTAFVAPVTHLRLAVEEPVRPFDAQATDQAWQVHKRIWAGVLKLVLAGALLIAGWYAFVQVIPQVIQSAMQPNAAKPVAKNPPMEPAAPIVGAPSIQPPLVGITAGPSKAELEAKRDADLAAIEALLKQKLAAWTAYFKQDASCEHPVSWSVQVECGNQYMRAKQAFEEKWARAHGISVNESPVVIDNKSFEKAKRSSAAERLTSSYSPPLGHLRGPGN